MSQLDETVLDSMECEDLTGDYSDMSNILSLVHLKLEERCQNVEDSVCNCLTEELEEYETELNDTCETFDQLLNLVKCCVDRTSLIQTNKFLQGAFDQINQSKAIRNYKNILRYGSKIAKQRVFHYEQLRPPTLRKSRLLLKKVKSIKDHGFQKKYQVVQYKTAIDTSLSGNRKRLKMAIRKYFRQQCEEI